VTAYWSYLPHAVWETEDKVVLDATHEVQRHLMVCVRLTTETCDEVTRQRHVYNHTHRQTDMCAVRRKMAGMKYNKHNCVLSNAGLSNALTETGICTSLKSDFYFQFHSPLNTKSALPNIICTWDLVLIC